MGIPRTYQALLDRLLPEDVTVHQGQFHQVVIGAESVVCLPRTDAAAARLPERAAVLRVLAELDLGFATPRPLGESGPGEPPYLLLSRVPGAPLKAGAPEDLVAAEYVRLLAALAKAGADERPVLVLAAIAGAGSFTHIR
ncbi:phosphotransferase, partial [Nonomuraea sp. NPDC050643]|uniref:phosphotransferase n=1 Tax=Nonomuraea sp. NPDC050643 TaxID=3155660 RepID=UPI0033F1A1C4